MCQPIPAIFSLRIDFAPHPSGIALTAISVPDDPAADLFNPPRTLEFSVKLESSPGCSCTHKSATLTARQTLDPGGYPNSMPSLQLPDTFTYQIVYED